MAAPVVARKGFVDDTRPVAEPRPKGAVRLPRKRIPRREVASGGWLQSQNTPPYGRGSVRTLNRRGRAQRLPSKSVKRFSEKVFLSPATVCHSAPVGQRKSAAEQKAPPAPR